MSKVKIILDIDGGVLQAIYSNSSEVEVSLIDWDNMSAPEATAVSDGIDEAHINVLSDEAFETKYKEIYDRCLEKEEQNKELKELGF